MRKQNFNGIFENIACQWLSTGLQPGGLDLNWDQAAIRDRYCPIDSIFTNSQSEMVDCLDRTVKDTNIPFGILP